MYAGMAQVEQINLILILNNKESNFKTVNGVHLSPSKLKHCNNKTFEGEMSSLRSLSQWNSLRH